MNRGNPNAYADIFENPLTYRQAWDHPCSWQRAKWRESISKELRLMNECKVWKKVKLTDVPKDKRLITCKWVFLVKKMGHSGID